jgi:hypothetical protein
MGRKPLFGVAATLGLAALLLVPFAVRSLTDAEPYPAVLFPVGSGTVPVNNGIVTFSYLSAVGFDAHGQPHVLDAANLLEPIPVSYLDALAGTSFGQTVTPNFDLTVKGVGTVARLPRHQPSAAEQAAARTWLARKLGAAGLSEDRIVIRNELVSVKAATGDEVSRQLMKEQTIALG